VITALRLAALASHLVERREHVAAVLCRADFIEDATDAALFINDERRAPDAPHLAPVHILLGPHAVAFSGLVIGVRQ
jgi:hypothetical protein